MPDIKQVLNDEIRRIARREVKAALKPVAARIAELRKCINGLNGEIRELKKCCSPAMVAPAVEALEEKRPAESKIPRITKERIFSLREKLGLSRKEYARLLGVSPASVLHWESGHTIPRREQKIRIAEIRDKKKSDCEKLMIEKGIRLPDAGEAPAAGEVAIPFDKDLLIEFRKTHRLSQARTAALLGVYFASVGRWESGASVPRKAQKAKIAALLELSAEQVAKALEKLPPLNSSRAHVKDKAANAGA